MKYYSPIHTGKIMTFAATWIQLEMIILIEVSQKEKDKCSMLSLMSGIYNMAQINLSSEADPQTQRADLWLPKGSGERKSDGQGIGGWWMHSITFRMDKQ